MTSTKRRIWPVAAQLVVVLVACAVAVFFTFVNPSGVSLVKHFTPATLGDQPAGAVVLGQESGKLAVGIAAAPRTHGLLVVLTVFGPTGRGQAGLRPRVTITDSAGSPSSATAGSCGAGCYEAVFPTTDLPRRAAVSFNDGNRAAFSFPAHGPSAQALKIVHQAEAEYKQVRSMVTHETLGSSPTQVTDTTYYSVAPHRLRFVVKGEDESIIIGKRRWDRNLGGPWRESSQSVITPIAPYWTPLVTDATLLGSTTVNGRPVWKIAFGNPQTPGFFTIWVDKQNHRTLELRMTAAAHFMHHLYTDFDAPLKIKPPQLTVSG